MLSPNRLEFINYLQNVNNFRNDIWKSILTTLQQSTLFGADLVELNSLLHTSLQSIFESTNSKQTGTLKSATLQQPTQQHQQPSLNNLNVRLQCATLTNTLNFLLRNSFQLPFITNLIFCTVSRQSLRRYHICWEKTTPGSTYLLLNEKWQPSICLILLASTRRSSVLMCATQTATK